MKKILILFLLICSNISLGQSKAIDLIKNRVNEISSEYKTSEKLKCQSIQSTLLYKNPEIHSYIFGNTIHKEFQTFKYKGNQGSILYFEFENDADNAKVFVEALLWGGKKPTKSHPESILTKGKTMIILSFPLKSKIRKELNDLLSKN